jgi:hypothetical protein
MRIYYTHLFYGTYHAFFPGFDVPAWGLRGGIGTDGLMGGMNIPREVGEWLFEHAGPMDEPQSWLGRLFLTPVGRWRTGHSGIITITPEDEAMHFKMRWC